MSFLDPTKPIPVYDPIKAQKALRTATVYERLPGSEFVLELAAMLESADAVIRGSSDKIRDAENNARNQQRFADEARAALDDHQKHGGVKLEKALTVLRDIASSTKGGKAKAEAALKEIAP
jgi:uncharacterized protein (UPF0147 family)